MKQIVIISGKGGTGKTSVTGSLAALASNAVIADCDVDAADLHLLLNPTLIEQHPFISGHEAIIDPQLCTSCGLCEEYCRFDVIEQLPETYRVKAIGCEGCKVCVEVCPEAAILFPSSRAGDCYRSTTQYGPLLHARLKAGAENSGKLVTKVRDNARALAQESSADWIIIDGPPGVGCPVISAVTGVDLAVIVTEPTPSGLHDLDRALHLNQHFSIPSLVVINKWDLHAQLSNEIELLANSYSAPIIGKLPYSGLFNQAQVNGMPLITFAPNSLEASEIKNIWNNIQTYTKGETL